MSLPNHVREWILAVEGGESNDPDDPGKRTKYGISSRAFPEVNLDTLTEDGAIAIYERAFWLPLGCDKLQPALALCLFDAGVHHGLSRAVILLQRALVVQKQSVILDGIMGDKTRVAAWRCDPAELVAEMLWNRDYLIRDIAKRIPSQGKWLHGWGLRLFKLAAACAKVA